MKQTAQRVLLLDMAGLHRARVGPLITLCGATSHLIGPPIPGKALHCPPCCHVLLMALEGPPGPNTREMAAILAFKEKGFTILAFADGVESWPVREQCQIHLAGASHLLDSGRPEFERQLCGLLLQLLQAEAGQEADERRIKERMAAAGVVGVSAAMIGLFRTVLRISVWSDLPVLLTGESGTGKELLARAIHAFDPKQCHGPFLSLNCAAVPSGLLESELFGHRRGSFTGAVQDKKGLFRAADGGVLLLDEIGDLELGVQPKVLRAIQEGRVLGVGEEKEVPVNVRVLAATHRDLEGMIKQGRFREDLFYRLNVLPVHVPALRERLEDIEPLIRFFLKKHSRTGNPCLVGSGFLGALRRLDWHGNVRELENLVKQVLVNNETARPISLSDLPVTILERLGGPASTSVAQQSQREAGADAAFGHANQAEAGNPQFWDQLLQAHNGNLERCREACEQALVNAVLRRTNWNQSEAARALGITRRTVYNKLHTHPAQSPDGTL